MTENTVPGYRYVPARWFWFHWINVVCVLLLVFLAFVMMFRGEIGMPSFETKIGLKKLHTWVGYIFIANLAYRCLWSLFKNPDGFRAGLRQGLGIYGKSAARVVAGKKLPALGVVSVNRLVIITLFLLMTSSIVSGLYRAGSDLYYPPLGYLIKHFVVKPGEDADSLEPMHWKQRNKYVDGNRQRWVDGIGRVMGILHRYSGYAIMVLAIVHMIVISRLFIRRRQGDPGSRA